MTLLLLHKYQRQKETITSVRITNVIRFMWFHGCVANSRGKWWFWGEGHFTIMIRRAHTHSHTMEISSIEIAYDFCQRYLKQYRKYHRTIPYGKQKFCEIMPQFNLYLTQWNDGECIIYVYLNHILCVCVCAAQFNQIATEAETLVCAICAECLISWICIYTLNTHIHGEQASWQAGIDWEHWKVLQ